MNRGAVDLDRLAELEEEQRFLLRSLADLDREHDAGDVDDVDYVTLRDGYTARAAAVLRSIEAGRATLPPPRRRNRWAVLGTVVAVVTVAVGAGILVARSAGQDLVDAPAVPGELTGDDVSSTLSQARLLLAGGDVQAAFELYSAVLRQAPDDVEANTYAAWLLVLDAGGLDADVRSERVGQGMLLLRRAIELDPAYPDAHCFAAIVAANFVDPPDAALARSEGQACLDLVPPAEIRTLVETFLARLDDAAPDSTTTLPAG